MLKQLEKPFWTPSNTLLMIHENEKPQSLLVSALFSGSPALLLIKMEERSSQANTAWAMTRATSFQAEIDASGTTEPLLLEFSRLTDRKEPFAP